MIQKPNSGCFLVLAYLTYASCPTAVAAAPSSLQSIDHVTYGPNSLTRDSKTNLDWLDWSLTTNRSVSDISKHLSPGGEFDGFRYATEEEVISLYQNAGFSAIDAFTYGRTEDYNTANEFVDLFGLTQDFDDGLNVRFLTRAFLGPDAHPTHGYNLEVLVYYNTFRETGFAGANGGFVGPVGIGDSPHIATGHALVREVPEPNVFVLLLLPALIIFSSRTLWYTPAVI